VDIVSTSKRETTPDNAPKRRKAIVGLQSAGQHKLVTV
jgi:hypothetical protein